MEHHRGTGIPREMEIISAEIGIEEDLNNAFAFI